MASNRRVSYGFRIVTKGPDKSPSLPEGAIGPDPSPRKFSPRNLPTPAFWTDTTDGSAPRRPSDHEWPILAGPSGGGEGPWGRLRLGMVVGNGRRRRRRRPPPPPPPMFRKACSWWIRKVRSHGDRLSIGELLVPEACAELTDVQKAAHVMRLPIRTLPLRALAVSHPSDTHVQDP
jgi:hypothetical protein